MSLIKTFLFLTVFLCSCNYAQETVTYHLTKSVIESVTYRIAPDSTYSISIKLNPAGTKKFEAITKMNIGKLLKIYKNSHLIQEAVIKVVIPNGRISVSNLRNSKEVINYIKILLD